MNNDTAERKMAETFKRYFVGNHAPVLSIKRSLVSPHWRPLRCFTGNSGGYYWGYWRITWRKPFADCWAFNETRQRWEIKS